MQNTPYSIIIFGTKTALWTNMSVLTEVVGVVEMGEFQDKID